jgi:4'-phosphopantetheinyl transferase
MSVALARDALPMSGGAMDLRGAAVLWWLAADDEGCGDWNRLEALLDRAERDRASRFHFRHDYCSYVAAHALARCLLSSVVGGAPQEWRFTAGAHGKPEPVAAGPFRLNLSHTRGLAVAALTAVDDIGVDAEWLNRQPPAHDLAQRYFAPSECAALEAAGPADAGIEFLRFWTLKEAYVKAVGKGLSLPLQSLAFMLDPPSVSFMDGQADDPAQWQFHQFNPTPDHVVALALHYPRQRRGLRLHTVRQTAAGLGAWPCGPSAPAAA